MLCFTYCAIRFSTLVLQQSPDSLSPQHFTKDVTKSSSMDFRSILHISYARDWGHIRSSSYTPSSQKTLWLISFMWIVPELSLPSNHIISNILSSNKMQERSCHISSIDYLTAKQRIWLKSPLINVDNKYNEFFPFFSFFNKEFEPGNRLIDLFSDHFSFHFCFPNLKKHIEKLDKITFRVSSNPSSTIVVSDASIKNQVATSILHIYSYNKPVVKTLHRAINITTTEVDFLLYVVG